MNDQPHTHRLIYRADLGGQIEYGDQHAYLHLTKDGEPPRWWPRWYLNWKTKRIITRLVRRHDEASQPAPKNPVTRMGAVRALVAEADSALQERESGSWPTEDKGNKDG